MKSAMKVITKNTNKIWKKDKVDKLSVLPELKRNTKKNIFLPRRSNLLILQHFRANERRKKRVFFSIHLGLSTIVLFFMLEINRYFFLVLSLIFYFSNKTKQSYWSSTLSAHQVLISIYRKNTKLFLCFKGYGAGGHKRDK